MTNNPETFSPFYGEIKYKNGVAYVTAVAGTINEYYNAAKELLKNTDDQIHSIVFEFQCKTITIDESTTIDEVYETLNIAAPKRGLTEEELKQQYDNLILNLNEVKPCDLVSGEVDESEVVDFAKKISRILVNAKEVIVNKETAKELAYKLIKCGCVTFESVNNKYLDSNEDLNLKQMEQIHDKINLPALLWTNLILADPTMTNYALYQFPDLLANWTGDYVDSNEDGKKQD